jgi:hypothetical protein
MYLLYLNVSTIPGAPNRPVRQIQGLTETLAEAEAWAAAYTHSNPPHQFPSRPRFISLDPGVFADVFGNLEKPCPTSPSPTAQRRGKSQ